jgi:HD-GYP domain-containing protein (c-di-GMP phosphodiesterase class II)
VEVKLVKFLVKLKKMLARLRQAYVPIFTQITVPYILLALLIAAGGTYVVSRLVFDSVEERFTNQLIETALLAKESLVQEEEDLLEAVRLASHIQGVDTAVQNREFQQLSDFILPVAFNSSLDALAVLDLRGFTLLALRLNNEGNEYESLALIGDFSEHGFVQDVLAGAADEAGDKFGGVVTTESGDFFFISGPIQDTQGNLVGVILVGRSVQSLADLLRVDTGGQVSFYNVGGQPLNTTLAQSVPIPPADAQESLARQDEGSLTRALSDSGIEYNELLSPWEVRAGEDMGLMGIAIPTHFLVRASEISRGNTLLLMSLSVALVVLVGLLVARRISLPIRRLRDAAVQVGSGNLRVRVEHPSRDEVGVLTKTFNEMVGNLSKSERDLLSAYDMTIVGWSKATDLRDHETEGHSQRVADLAVALASAMGIKAGALVHIRRGALLHDIGKIAIPDSILLKPGKLTEVEMERMRQHPAYAKAFIDEIDFLKLAMAIPYNHHEKWDGTGYPKGLKGEEIPLEARIFAIVDVWDALTSDRPYRKAQGFKETLAYIQSESGKHFDPAVVKAFVKLMGR